MAESHSRVTAVCRCHIRSVHIVVYRRGITRPCDVASRRAASPHPPRTHPALARRRPCTVSITSLSFRTVMLHCSGATWSLSTFGAASEGSLVPPWVVNGTMHFKVSKHLFSLRCSRCNCLRNRYVCSIKEMVEQ